MKFDAKLGMMIAVCLLIMGCSGGGGGDDGDGDKNINGLWQYMNVNLCNGLSHDYYTDKYLEVTDGGFRNYQCYGAVCYYCPEDDAVWSGALDTSNISVHEDTMTLTVNENTTCPMTMTLERANQSDIQGVLENCNMITEEEW